MMQTQQNLSQTINAKTGPNKEKVSLNDGLPKPDPKKVVEELKTVLFNNDNFKRYFPDEIETRYRANFNLFDRDGDERINLSELKELLVSIGQIFDEQELDELYEVLQDPDGSGMASDKLYILVSKKIRENDKEEQLIEGIKFIKFQFLKYNEDTGYINEENFKELLMSFGQKWSEEDADELLKFCDSKFGDPKGEGKFLYMDAVKKILK